VVKHTFIIAEAGVNHNGSLARALDLVRVAAEVGADAVKFQTFKAEALVSASAPMADYQKTNMGEDGAQLAMLKALELSFADFQAIAEECARCGIEFMSTPFDESSADELEQLGMTTWKIPSGEVTNLPLIRHIAGKPGRVILSTGMSDLEEVRMAVEAIRSCVAKSNLPPPWGGGGFEGASATEKTGAGSLTTPSPCPLPLGSVGEGVQNPLVILHCTSSYPAPFSSLNLRAMETLRREFDVETGLSDHSVGIEAAVAAVALGATFIEKHFTLDRNLPGPDHKASLEPGELKQMIQAIRNIEVALGDGEKRITGIELNTRDVARRSCVLVTDLSAGHVLTRSDITLRRPGTGIQPADLDNLIGKTLKRDIKQGELFAWEDLE